MNLNLVTIAFQAKCLQHVISFLRTVAFLSCAPYRSISISPFYQRRNSYILQNSFANKFIREKTASLVQVHHESPFKTIHSVFSVGCSGPLHMILCLENYADVNSFIITLFWNQIAITDGVFSLLDGLCLWFV